MKEKDCKDERNGVCSCSKLSMLINKVRDVLAYEEKESLLIGNIWYSDAKSFSSFFNIGFTFVC